MKDFCEKWDGRFYANRLKLRQLFAGELALIGRGHFISRLPHVPLESGLRAGVRKMKCSLPINGSSPQNNLLVFSRLQ